MNNNVIQKDMLENLVNCSCLKNLSGDINVVNSSSILDNFINDKGVLQGNQWDVVRSKLTEYNSLLVMRSKVADNLIVAIKNAVKKLQDYLGEDLYLDSSKLDELRELKRRCEENISNLKELINSQTLKKVMLSDGTEKEQLVYVYSEESRNEFRIQINEMESNVLPEVTRLIKKTEGLESVYSDAKSLLMGEYDNIKLFYDEVSKIVPSNKVYFNPNS